MMMIISMHHYDHHYDHCGDDDGDIMMVIMMKRVEDEKEKI